MTNTAHDTDPENDGVDFGLTTVKAFCRGFLRGLVLSGTLSALQEGFELKDKFERALDRINRSEY